MKRIAICATFALTICSTQTRADDSREFMMNAPCSTFVAYMDSTPLFRRDVVIFYDGLIQAAEVAGAYDPVVRREFRRICYETPKMTVRETMVATIEAAHALKRN